MKVWLLQTGEPLPCDRSELRPMRSINLSDALVERGHDVVLWSAAYSHQEKMHRSTSYERIRVNDRLEVRLIPSMGYRRNVGLERLMDHAQLAFRLKQEIKKEQELPDVAFVGYPPIETAAVMTAFLKQKGVPVMLDVKDQWPDIFLEPFPNWIKPLVRIALFPYYSLGKRAMRDSTALSSMADGFLNWSREFSNRSESHYDGVFPLSPGRNFVTDEEIRVAGEWWDSVGVRDDGSKRFVFVGSLSPAFDFLPVKQAAEKCLFKGLGHQFVICGNGALNNEIRKLMSGLGNVVIPGWINKAKIKILAQRSTACLAPYINTDNFKYNIPNKILDSFSFGLPLITSLEGEVELLAEKYKVALLYGGGGRPTLYDCVELIANYPDLQHEIASNGKSLYTNKFSCEIVYKNFAERLELMARTRL